MTDRSPRGGNGSFADLIRLSRLDRSKLLCRLDDGPRPDFVDERRIARRWQYRVTRIPMTVQHPGGGGGAFTVCGRNLSTTGMSFLHGGYLHVGSDVRVLLRRWDGRPRVLDGVVARCRLVEGAVHEIGVHFATELEIGDLLPPEITQRTIAAGDELPTTMLIGTVLFASEAEVERRLMAHCLRETGVVLRTAATRGEALDIVKRERVDVVLADVNVDRADPAGFIRAMRATGYRGAIVIATGDEDVQGLVRTRSAGANEVIGKPYAVETLVTLLAEWLADGPLEDPVFSTLEDRPGMPEMIVDYIEHAQRLCRRIDAALDDRDIGACRRSATELRASGSGFGFEALSNAARDAIRAIESARRVDDAEPAFRRLAALGGRLRCSTATRPVRRG